MKVNNKLTPKCELKNIKNGKNSRDIKKLSGEVEIEKWSGEYTIFFKDYEARAKRLSWYSHNLYGKGLSDGGNVKANDSGYWRGYCRIWEPSSILNSWKMEVVRSDGWGKPWAWKVDIGAENVRKLVETEETDQKKELKRLAWHLARTKEEDKKRELVSDYNYLAESLGVAKIEASTK